MRVRILFIILLALNTNLGWGQNDFSVNWSSYATGDTISDLPFLGNFSITNVGTTTIPVNDTIYYGYMINDVKYDLGLSEGLVSGQVLLEEPFEPGDELTVINSFAWPELGSGDTVQMCAVVYGEGIESFTGDLFTGDDSIANNQDCVSAVLPEYSVSIESLSSANENQIYVQYMSKQLVLKNNAQDNFGEGLVQVTSINGRIVLNESFSNETSVHLFDVGHLKTGVYIVHLVINGIQTVEKIFIP